MVLTTTTTTQHLSSGLEDYIETIYVSEQLGIYLKGAELARKLFISRASVSEALSKLVTLGLIEYESYGVIKLTKKGVEEAQKVYQKHKNIKEFLQSVLGIEEKEAGEVACRLEHVVSQNTINKMIKFTKFCETHQELIEEFKELRD